MNKILASLFIAASAFALTGCVGEEDDLFDKSATERLDEISGIYTQRLASSEGGWIMEYYPQNSTEEAIGYGYLIACKFDKNHEVTCGAKNAYTYNNYKEAKSIWEIITDDGPVLSFNSRNDVMHIFSQPLDIPGTEDDELGRGFEGDYEFIITDLQEGAEQAMLKGKKRGTYNRITRLPAGTDYEAYIDDVDAFIRTMFPLEGANELRLHIGSKDYNVDGMNSRMPNIYPADGDKVIDKSLETYLMTKRDGKYCLRFRSPIGTGDEKEQEFIYNEATDAFEGVDNSKNILRGLIGSDLPVYLTTESGVGIVWNITRMNPPANKFDQLFEGLYTGFPAFNKQYSFTSATFTPGSDQTANIKLTYKQGRSSKAVSYRYDLQKTDTGIIFSAPVAYNDEAQSLMDNIPELTAFLNSFTGEQSTSLEGSGFAVKSIRFTAKDDPNYSFVINRAK